MSDPEGRPEAGSGEITRLLAGMRGGDELARDRLFELAYGELKWIARRQLRGRSADQTLQTTALVHEAYLRLSRASNPQLVDRAHFFAVAARAMRQIVIDHARARLSAKRGQGRPPVSIDAVQIGERVRPEAELLALDGALEELERQDARLGRVVELRFFGGMTTEEIGTVLDVTARTVKRDWRRARAFLQSRLTAADV